MEITTISFLVLLPVTVVTILLLRIWRGHERRRLPPGPWGVPILGSLPFVNPELHRYFADLAEKYGPVLSLRLGSKLLAIISSPSAVEEVLKVHDTVFANHTVSSVAHALNDGVDLVWTPYSPLWRFLRRVTVREVLSPQIIDSFLPLRRQLVHGMISELKSKVGTMVNIRDALQAVTLDQMLGMIWEDVLKEEGSGMKREFLEVFHGIGEIIAAPNISDFLPFLAPLDLQGMQRKMKVLSARFNAIVDSIMKQRVPSGVAATKGGRAADFIQLLVDLIDNRGTDMPLEAIHARGIIFDLLFGGTDTISSTMEWAMSELLRHPEIMAKVQEELNLVVGRGGVLEESHVTKLEYPDAVLKETLRVHPVLPLMIPHAPSTTCEVGGYTIPEGTSVFVNVWAIHRDPSVWKEPLEFRPERFVDRKDDLRYNGKSFEYIPFGSGRRICVGLILAERTMAYILGSLLHAFEWRLPQDTTTIDVEDKYAAIMKMKEPLVLVPTTKERSGSSLPASMDLL